MAPQRGKETPTEAFQRLRQCFDVIKSHHSDPWAWHTYLEAEPDIEEDEDEDEDDPEMLSLLPKPRRNVDRAKSHLLATVSELARASQAADFCYYHLCCSPEEMRDCITILGTAGDIDEDLLKAAGDVSPQKIMAALQTKLDEAHTKIASLEEEVTDLRVKLTESRIISQDRWLRWQQTAMLAEDAMNRLDGTTRSLHAALDRERLLQAAYNDLFLRMVRAKRLMAYKARQMLRDQIFGVRKAEVLFYCFHGFIETLVTEKQERLQREKEEQRDFVEFSLRNEVKFLLGDRARICRAMESITLEAGRLKKDRRALACRLLYKNRPREPLEYCLWVWELWQPVRTLLVREKALEAERASHYACAQQLAVTTSKHMPVLTQCIDELKLSLAGEKLAHEASKRELTLAGARQFAQLITQIHKQRTEELARLSRLHQIDIEGKDERIAVLEREIAEDKHVQALKGMVVDLEGNLKKALDRRKQKGFVVPPNGGTKCSQCSRETLLRNWKDMPPGLAQSGLSHSVSDVDLGSRVATGLNSLALPNRTQKNWLATTTTTGKQASYTATWRA